MSIPRWLRLTFAVVLLGGLSLGTALAQDDASASTGELWETTSQTVMEGMPMNMPAQIFQVCSASDWTAPPGADSEEMSCSSSNPQRNGLKVTWTSVCTGDMEMTGEGEITFEDESMDAYSGEIHYTTDFGNVTVTLSGRRLGVCDNPM